VNGWFVEHDACSIARRLQALTDPAQRERMGRSARDSVRPFSWDNVVQRYSALYAELAQDHRAVR
jgi:glycosyltransferase involved in cell wall biosynthesis